MKIFLCQTRAKMEYLAISFPFAQFALAAYIEDIADVKVSGWTYRAILPSNDEIMNQIKEFKPDVVGITIEFTLAFTTCLELAQRIKEWNPGVVVVGGGHQGTFTAEKLLTGGWFDAIFLGEGEISFREYIIKKDFRNVPGVMYRDGSGFINTGRAPLVSLDDLKPPAYHLLPKNSFKPAIMVESSRGCPYNCDYCETRHFFGNGRMRKMSPGHFVDIVKYLQEHFGGGLFGLMDDNMAADMRGHVKPICERIIAEDLKLTFNCTGRVDDFIENVDLLPVISRAGFKVIGFGVESIFDESLKAMNKRARYGQEEIKRLVQVLKENGMAIFISIVFGYPNETPDMIQKTIDFFISQGVDAINWNIATPLPGSDLFKRALANNEILSQNYDEYDLLHRVWSNVPETTIPAAKKALKKFFIRPEFIRKTYNWVLDKPDVMGASVTCNVMNSNLASPLRCRPDSSEEWLRFLEGINLLLKDRFVSNMADYNKIVQFKLGSADFSFTIKDGVLDNIGIENTFANMVVKTDADTVVDLFIWYSLDILSACILGKVQISEVSVIEKMKFIKWITQIQETLRWLVLTKMDVPVLRHRIQEWIEMDENRQKRFAEIIDKKGLVFVGEKNVGGIIICFEGNRAANVELSFGYPSEVNFELLVNSTQLGEIFNGEIGFLYELLEIQPLKRTATRLSDFVQPQEFFHALPRKFKPERAGDLDLVLQYKIQDEKEQEENWWLKIREQKLTAEQGVAPEKPNVEISIKKDNFIRLINGLVIPVELVTQGKMALKGQPTLVLRMDGCFENIFGTEKRST